VPVCATGICSYLTKDADGDGVRASRCQSLDPNVGVNVGRDCDDSDPLVSPVGWDGPATGSLPNNCNDGLDNDCSATIDDGVAPNGATCICSPGETTPCSQTSSGLPITYPALDGTGKPLGACKLGSKTCQPNGTYAECSGAMPPQPETCDGSDNDCDGIASKIDSDTPKPSWLCDADSDGHLPKNTTGQKSCDAPTSGCAGNWVLENSEPMDDCVDTDSSIHPGATELCDGKDNNCNELVDDAAVDMKIWSYDADGDLYRRTEFATIEACAAPTAAPADCADYQTSCPATAWHGGANPLPTGDCNDNAVNRNPGALKDLCDGSDYNCDGSVLTGCTCQSGHTQSCGEHAGYDGVGVCTAGTQTCIGGAWGDCVGAVGPVPEKCGTSDLDCDRAIGNNDASATDMSNYYCDKDSDGFLAPNASKVVSCLTPTSTCTGSWRKNPAPGDFTDCSDSDNAIYPGAAERCNLLDDNCDKSAGLTSPAAEPVEDADGDGFASTTAPCTGGTLPRSDCWDSDARVHPGQAIRYADGYCTNSAYPSWCGDPAYRICTPGTACSGLPTAGVEASYDFNCDNANTPYDKYAIGMTEGLWGNTCSGMKSSPDICPTLVPSYTTAGSCGKSGTYRTCAVTSTGTVGGVTVYLCGAVNVTQNVACF
jgi:large repetitive protein